MLHVRIYRPSKTAMQSGKAKTLQWVLEGLSQHRRNPEPLMGWVSSQDTFSQIKLFFPTKEAAIEYAQEKGWYYTVLPEHNRVIRAKSYSENFVKPALQ